MPTPKATRVPAISISSGRVRRRCCIGTSTDLDSYCGWLPCGPGNFPAIKLRIPQGRERGENVGSGVENPKRGCRTPKDAVEFALSRIIKCSTSHGSGLRLRQGRRHLLQQYSNVLLYSFLY